MTDFQAYETVLSDLRSKLIQIENAIAAIEALRPQGPALPRLQPGEEARKGPWANMPVADAAKALLQTTQKAMLVGDIYAVLVERGVNVSSANVVSSILSRRAKEREDVVRVGRGLWAIATPAFNLLALPPTEDVEEEVDPLS